MSQPTVTVNIRCDRTEKEKPVQVELDKVQTVLNQVGAKQKAAAALQTELASIDPISLPDLIVCFRGQICILANINESSDVVISRNLQEATGKENLFIVDPSKIKRKPRKVVKEIPDSGAGNE